MNEVVTVEVKVPEAEEIKMRTEAKEEEVRDAIERLPTMLPS